MTLGDLKPIMEWTNGVIQPITKTQLEGYLDTAKQLPFVVGTGEDTFNVWASGPDMGQYYVVLTKRLEYDEKDNTEIIGGLILNPVDRLQKIYQVLAVYLNSSFRGNGIIPNLYISLISHFKIKIINSEQLSSFAEKMWTNFLSNNMAHDVKIWDKKENKEYQLSDIGKTLPDGTSIVNPRDDKNLPDSGKQRFFLMIESTNHDFWDNRPDYFKKMVYREKGWHGCMYPDFYGQMLKEYKESFNSSV